METNSTYEKLGKQMMRTDFLIIAGLLFLEFTMYPVFSALDITKMAFMGYAVKYALVPLAFNGTVFLAGFYLMWRPELTGRQKLYIPLFCMSATGMCVAYVHQLFAVTMCFSSTVILISGMFGSTVVAKRSEGPLTLAVIDIDNFKKVNDQYGYENGNTALVALSKVLTEACGDGGVVCRYGGPEENLKTAAMSSFHFFITLPSAVGFRRTKIKSEAAGNCLREPIRPCIRQRGLGKTDV